jgi:hypothetical protein
MLSLSRQAVITPLVGFLCVLSVGWLQFPQLQSLLRSKEYVAVEALEREVNREKIRLNFFKRMPSFGYDNLIANWIYLGFLQYFGDEEARAKTGYSLTPEYFEVILERDPRFIAAYLSLSTGASIYAGMPERAIEIMERALDSLTPGVPKRSYYAWRYKAIDELLFLGDTQAAQNSFATAAEWASKFDDEESQFIASISQRTAQFLSNNPRSKHAQISAWTMVLNSQTDEKTRERAIREIEALGGKIVSTPEGNMIQFPPSDE